MALTESSMQPLGSKAPNFHLVDAISNQYFTFDDLKSSKCTVIMFICNHCPFVIHVNHELVSIANEYKDEGVSFIAINSNDVESYPEDAPDKMSIVAKVLKYPFPYLFDKRQEAAKSYGAECTPDFFVYDGLSNLTYRGRLDDSRPGNGIEVTGKDLRNAIEATLQGRSISDQFPSAGCNIKWK